MDLLGAEGRARILSRILLSLQEQEYELTLLKAANGAEDHETVHGEDFTYGTRLEALKAGQARLLEAVEPSVIRRMTDGE